MRRNSGEKTEIGGWLVGWLVGCSSHTNVYHTMFTSSKFTLTDTGSTQKKNEETLFEFQVKQLTAHSLGSLGGLLAYSHARKQNKNDINLFLCQSGASTHSTSISFSRQKIMRNQHLSVIVVVVSFFANSVIVVSV